MATQIGSAFFDVTFNTTAARREITALVSTANRSFGLLGGIGLVAAATAVAGLTKATVDLGQAGVDAFADYEQAFASVRKVLDDGTLSVFNASQMFGELNQELRDLALELPLDLEDDISNIAALGGQLGLLAPDIEEFTRVIGEIGVTTNVAVDDAATSFARLGNVLDVPASEFRELGDTLINLGNKLPAQEDEILRFSARIAAAGRIAGLTADEVLAISAAFTSVGVPAERGGTAFQRTIIKITEAVAEGTDALAVFGEVSGMTAQEFATLWRDDASAAFVEFIEGIGQLGPDAFRILDELGLAEQRTVQALLSLASAGDLTRTVFQLAADDAGALATESSIFFGTTQSNIQLLSNTVHDASITIGEGLAPAFNNVVDAITAWIIENDELIRQLGVDLGDALRGLIPVMTTILGVIGDLVSGWASFIETLTTLPDDEIGFGPENLRGLQPGEEFADFMQRGLLFDPHIAGFVKGFKEFFLDAAGVPGQGGGLEILTLAESDLRRELLDGVPVVEAMVNALGELDAELAESGIKLSEFGISEILDEAELTEQGIRDVIQAAIDAGIQIPRALTDAFGVTVPAGTHPRFGGEGFGQITPAISSAATAAVLDEFTFDQAEATAEAAAQAEAYADALNQITDAAAAADIPLSVMLDNADTFLETLTPDAIKPLADAFGADFIGPVEQARLELDLFNNALVNLGADIELDHIPNLFEINILTPLEELVGETQIHGRDVVKNIEEQANAIAEAEAGLIILAAQGFTDLVAKLAAEGPSAFHAIADFVSGAADAGRAEAALEGGTISEELEAQMKAALESGDISPELLDLVSRMQTPEVQQAAYDEGLVVGEQMGAGIGQGLRNSLPGIIGSILLGVDLPTFDRPSFDSGINRIPNPRVPDLGFGESGKVNIVNNIATPSVPSSDIARLNALQKAIG